MKESQKINTRGLAISGILLGISVMTLYLNTILPIANYTLYMMSSLYVAAVILEAGTKAGWLFYIASCIFAFIFVPDKLFLIPYILFFGNYGIVKFYIERIGKITVELLLKFLYFNCCLGISIAFFKELLLGKLELPNFSGVIIILMLEAAFIAYDYFYTLIIDFYNKRIKKVNK
jgi:hypothetical protein